jgi:hypothetical protein
MQTFSSFSSGSRAKFGIFFCLLQLLLSPAYGQIAPAEKSNLQKLKIAADLLPKPKSIINTSTSGASFAPAWEQSRTVFIPFTQSFALSPWFDGAMPDPLLGNIPYYEIKVPVQGFEKYILSTVRTSGTENSISQNHTHVPAALGRAYTDAWYPAQPVVADEMITIRNQRYQIIRIYPVQVSKDGRSLQIHKEINYRLSPMGSPPSAYRVEKTLATSSVLATGDWYKIPVLRDGVHQLDASYLAGLGINISNINPGTLRLFTHLPGMLPQENHVFRYDDLVETPVWVMGENDGRFDPSDYLVFYGHGPHAWQYDTVTGQYAHATHVYADTAFYFLNFNQVSGKRVRAHTPSAPNTTSNTGRAVAFHEEDKVNLIKTGRQWFGESFDVSNSQTFSIPVSFPHPDSSIRLTVQAAARASIPTSFNISVNGIPVGPVQVNNVQLESYVGNYANIGRQSFLVSSGLAVNGNLPVTINYNRPSSAQGTNGWLDFIRVEYAKQLVMIGGQMQFYLTENVAPGNVTQLNIAAMNSEFIVWDITDIADVQQVNYTLSGSNASMAVEMSTRKSIAVFRSNMNALISPAAGYRIPNQNLHGQAQAEYILITAPGLQTQANQLADFHRNVMNQTVALATTDQIYNEFSAGKQDVSAIRDYVRMFYLRAGGDSAQMPKYVCLLGDASYDYRNRLGAGGNFLIPPYESRNSTSYTASFVSDDYYGFMDSNEGLWGEGTNNNPLDPLQNHGLDLGIGRLPAKASAEAQILVNKIVQYVNGKSNFGAWKNTVVMVADHKTDEGSIHVSQADSYSGLIQSEYPIANLEKVYLDYFKGINSAEGFIRFPDAKDALVRSLNQGSLIVNYTGHGGELGWSNSRILEIPDINAINNNNRLPLYMTATCEFGRFDNPELTSGAELIFLRENAGSIAMFTTVRLVYSGPNQALNQNFYRHVFRKDANTNNWLCLGDVYRFTKNDTWVTGGINTRSFALLGDPGIRLAFPVDQAVLTHINGIQINPVPDTMKALGLITLEGEVRNPSGGIREDYNGTLSVTVFDKPSRYSTIINPFNFLWQRNRIFNGSATVRNGKYTVQFKVPLDISYEVGPGKVSMYFENGYSDGAGYFSDFIVSGTDTSAVKDDTGPVIDLFMNDEKWADGGLVNQNPLLLAKVFDDSGINTLGAGIGHEITAVLNRDENKRLVLNDFYSAKKDSYREGQISYQYNDLPEGTYDLELKVWDIANNSSFAKTHFVVANNAKIALDHVLNYPNPFTTNTRFFFEHNQRGEMLQAVIKIFTVSGRLVKTLEHSFYGEASLVNDIQWDGLDDYGDRIGRGVYVYEVKLKVLSTGETASKYEKLVLLR